MPETLNRGSLVGADYRLLNPDSIGKGFPRVADSVVNAAGIKAAVTLAGGIDGSKARAGRVVAEAQCCRPVAVGNQV